MTLHSAFKPPIDPELVALADWFNERWGGSNITYQATPEGIDEIHHYSNPGFNGDPIHIERDVVDAYLTNSGFTAWRRAS